jgi:hypothetical protein
MKYAEEADVLNVAIVADELAKGALLESRAHLL